VKCPDCKGCGKERGSEPCERCAGTGQVGELELLTRAIVTRRGGHDTVQRTVVRHIVHCDRLLGEIASGLIPHHGVRLGALKVVLHVEDERYDFSVPVALESLAEDLYFDERGNWAHASRATVEVM